MSKSRIDKDAVLQATEGGKAVILAYCPASAVGFASGGRKGFKIREDDRNPSAGVFQRDGIWFIKDQGGGDNKAYNAIALVMEKEHLKFPQAIDYIAQRWAPHLLDEKKFVAGGPRARFEQAQPGDEEGTIVTKEGYTKAELAVLGWEITPEDCRALRLKAVEYKVVQRKSGGLCRLYSTDDYPMFYYDYGDWGRTYEPLAASKSDRFRYRGEKPDNFIFGEDEFLEIFQGLKDGKRTAPDNDDKWEDLVICSGGSDALNIHAAGFHVCWLNSETAGLAAADYRRLRMMARNLYLCFDQDDTGLAAMRRLAMIYLDLRIIELPADLHTVPSKGGPCKDAKDLFVHYRKEGKTNPRQVWRDCVKLSYSLKFWMERRQDDSFAGFEIDNEQLYRFLQANGYARIATPNEKKGYTFCRTEGNIVELIDEGAIASAATATMIRFLREHPEYYSRILVNTIYRSKQCDVGSLKQLPLIDPDFTAWDKDCDHVFFRNCTVRVTADGITSFKPQDSPYKVYKHKIVDFDYEPPRDGDAPFDIQYTPEFAQLKTELAAATPGSPEFFSLKKKVETFNPLRRYALDIRKGGHSFLRYLWNTGREYWRLEEQGLELTEEQKLTHQLHFVNKAVALGYLLYKHKDSGRAYSVYAMEMEEVNVGEHRGGTGKSLYAGSIKKLRNELFVMGQNMDAKNKFLFEGVEKGVTDVIQLDDLDEYMDLHKLMPMITGDMVINPKNVKSFVIPFHESPKIVYTSNHAMKKFDSSLRRRTWFTAFSDYYHPEDPETKMRERTPYEEFGKNLIDDYDRKEMNDFYTFMLTCLQMYLRFRERINPPMEGIERRNLKRRITEEFIDWADEYLADRLNQLFDRNDAYEAYKQQLSRSSEKFISAAGFRDRLEDYCQYKGYVFMPLRVMRSQSDVSRKVINRKENGVNKYYFYISDQDIDKQEDPDDLPE